MGGGPPSPINTISIRTLSRTRSQHEESASMAAAALANVSYRSTEHQTPQSILGPLFPRPHPPLSSPPCLSCALSPPFTPPPAPAVYLVLTSRPLVRANFCRFISRFNPVQPLQIRRTSLGGAMQACHTSESGKCMPGRKERGKTSRTLRMTCVKVYQWCWLWRKRLGGGVIF